MNVYEKPHLLGPKRRCQTEFSAFVKAAEEVKIKPLIGDIVVLVIYYIDASSRGFQNVNGS